MAELASARIGCVQFRSAKQLSSRISPTARLLSVANENRFKVVNLGLGRVALKTPHGFVSVNPANSEVGLDQDKPGQAETFQWMETLNGDTILLSLVTDRYLQAGQDGISANWPGPKPDRKDDSCFVWRAR